MLSGERRSRTSSPPRHEAMYHGGGGHESCPISYGNSTVPGKNTHEGCSGCDQGFGHLNIPVIVDPISQLFREEFWEGIATGEECSFEDFADQVISVDEVSVCRFVLWWASCLPQDSGCVWDLQGHPGRHNDRL
jgi:hypothetical protein